MTTKKKKSNKSGETIVESFTLFARWLLGAGVSFYGILILGVLPLYFEQGYTKIGTNKATFFRAASVKMAYFILPVLAIWVLFRVVALVTDKQKRKEFVPFAGWQLPDFFLLGYGLSVMLSYLCSDYKSTALWGTRGWFMGMLPHLILVAIYFLVSRFAFCAKWLLYLTMPISFVVCALAILNRFDCWILPMENSGLPNYISTVGNINWLCGYLMTVLFIGIGLFWLGAFKKLWQKILLMVYAVVGFAALVLQASDSGLFALIFVVSTMFVLSSKSENVEYIKRFWLLGFLFGFSCVLIHMGRILVPGDLNKTSGFIDLLTQSPCAGVICLLSALGYWYAGRNEKTVLWKNCARVIRIALPGLIALFALMIVVNTAKPGSLGPLSDQSIFTFNNRWGSNRGATWKLGFLCLTEQDALHTIVGVGPDCMVEHLYRGRSAELAAALKEAFPKTRLTNAHNELLTILVNEGILGLFTCLGFLLTLLRRLLASWEKNPYSAACGLCLVAYLFNNIWSFQQSLGVSTLFMVLGLGMYFVRAKESPVGKDN